MTVLQLIGRWSGDDRLEVEAVPNPERRPPSSFSETKGPQPIAPATDELLRAAVVASEFGFAFVSVELGDTAGRYGDDLSDTSQLIQQRVHAEVRRGDAGAAHELLRYAPHLFVRRVCLQDHVSSWRVYINRFGSLDVPPRGDVEPDDDLVPRLVALVEAILTR